MTSLNQFEAIKISELKSIKGGQLAPQPDNLSTLPIIPFGDPQDGDVDSTPKNLFSNFNIHF
ncbi:hypothetical protein U6A24_18880 [Aquimarina gracilis]|uniref:Bacteriocin-like protein n=1 Tax=Aquimarina gracilis TaxID=874422 RepID=A0ABU6A074_9FLAO|nr:hypothetical protein [Aquimarina gracilis]MEB3347548.1 hypothetical protein [Aquimarina gracilis]